MLDFRNHVADDDIRPMRFSAKVLEPEQLKQSSGWMLLSIGDLEDGKSFNSAPGVVLQSARREQTAQFSRLMRVERTEKPKRSLPAIEPAWR